MLTNIGAWLTDPAHWTGPGGIPQRILEHLIFAGVSLLIAAVIAIPLGILAAVRQGSWADHLCRIVVTAGVSLPVFFTGLLLVYVFYFILGWSPAPLAYASSTEEKIVHFRQSCRDWLAERD